MNDETKRAIWIIGNWLVESVSATDLDRLIDHVSADRLESDRKSQIADELALALGHPAFD